MSFSDTAFIFVLALIIFGPKKLPEIGRQLGRLVGEFRRASNEFKFQIEEELRLADLSDSSKRSASSSTAESSISEPDSTSSSIDSETASEDSTASDQTYAEDTLPVGQHPNMEYQDPYDLNDLNDLNEKLAESDSAGDIQEGEASADTVPTIRAAEGSQPRTTLPYAGTEPTDVETLTPAMGGEPESSAPVADISSATHSTLAPGHEPADPYAASTVADVTHG